MMFEDIAVLVLLAVIGAAVTAIVWICYFGWTFIRANRPKPEYKFWIEGLDLKGMSNELQNRVAILTPAGARLIGVMVHDRKQTDISVTFGINGRVYEVNEI